jgi:hypothetical protein
MQLHKEKPGVAGPLGLALAALFSGFAGFLAVVGEIAGIASLLAMRATALLLLLMAVFATFFASLRRPLRVVGEVSRTASFVIRHTFSPFACPLL